MFKETFDEMGAPKTVPSSSTEITLEPMVPILDRLPSRAPEGAVGLYKGDIVVRFNRKWWKATLQEVT